MSAARPPAWAERWLEACLPEHLRDAVLGDLHEELVEHVLPSRGPWRAWAWYVGQVLDSLAPVVLLSLRRGSGRHAAWTSVLAAVIVAVPVAAFHWIGDFARGHVPLRAGLDADPAFLWLTLAAGALVIALGMRAVGAHTSGVQVLLSMLVAPVAATAVLDVSPALFPLWYRVAWLVVAPAAVAGASFPLFRSGEA